MAEKDTVEFEEVPSETLARFLANQTFYRQEYGALSVNSLLFRFQYQNVCFGKLFILFT
jgi:hypothetical protein